MKYEFARIADFDIQDKLEERLSHFSHNIMMLADSEEEDLLEGKLYKILLIAIRD